MSEYPQGSMLAVLDEIIRDYLPGWLAELPEGWETKYIDYHPPLVERAHRQWGDYRVAIHRIHPCESNEAFVHPHPWPGAFLVFGRYEMGIGYGSGTETPPLAMTVLTSPGTIYEMVNPDCWHYVRPIDEPVITLMVTGPPWGRTAPLTATHPFRELTDDECFELFQGFESAFDSYLRR